jgi:hypothetical protein
MVLQLLQYPLPDVSAEHSEHPAQVPVCARSAVRTPREQTGSGTHPAPIPMSKKAKLSPLASCQKCEG